MAHITLVYHYGITQAHLAMAEDRTAAILLPVPYGG